MSLIRRYQDKQRGINRELHGSAEFANLSDIEAMHITKNDGVYIGGFQSPKGEHHYLRHAGPEHVICFAPTRSGKGVGLVVPTLLSWQHSCVVLDIKGENWNLTAGWRAKHAENVCLKFEPSALSGSCRFNPLSEVRYGTPHCIKDIQKILLMVVDPDGKGLEDHWAEAAHALLVGVTLHAFEVLQDKDEAPSLRTVADFLSDPLKPCDDLFEEMLGSKNKMVASYAREMLDKADNEKSGVLSTARRFLALYKDDVVAGNTSKSDFKISDLMHHKKPVSLFIVVPPAEMARLRPLIRLLLSQIVLGNCEKIEFNDGQSVKGYKHRLLLLLDEFTALGKMELLETALAYMAGYGLKTYLIVQDLSQIKKHYGAYESITSNCHVRIAYAPNRAETAKEISEMLGPSTVVKKQVTISGPLSFLSTKNRATSYTEIQRNLMTPAEVMSLKGIETDATGKCLSGGEMLIFIAGKKPIKGQQILYFKDESFLARSKIPAPQRSEVL